MFKKTEIIKMNPLLKMFLLNYSLHFQYTTESLLSFDLLLLFKCGELIYLSIHIYLQK